MRLRSFNPQVGDGSPAPNFSLNQPAEWGKSGGDQVERGAIMSWQPGGAIGGLQVQLMQERLRAEKEAVRKVTLAP